MIPLLALYRVAGAGRHGDWHTILIGFSVLIIGGFFSYWWLNKD